MQDLYQELNVPKDASSDDIKKSYRRLARKYHPDVSKEENAKEKFQAVQLAYEVLHDPERRAYYDQTGQTQKEDPEAASTGLLADVLKQALIRTIDTPWADQIRVAYLLLDDMQDTINRQLADCKAVMSKLVKHKGRVKTKDDRHNLYEAIREGEIARVQQMVDNHPRILENIRKVRKMLHDYESPPMQPPAPPTHQGADARWESINIIEMHKRGF